MVKNTKSKGNHHLSLRRGLLELQARNHQVLQEQLVAALAAHVPAAPAAPAAAGLAPTGGPFRPEHLAADLHPLQPGIVLERALLPEPSMCCNLAQ